MDIAKLKELTTDAKTSKEKMKLVVRRNAVEQEEHQRRNDQFAAELICRNIESKCTIAAEKGEEYCIVYTFSDDYVLSACGKYRELQGVALFVFQWCKSQGLDPCVESPNVSWKNNLRYQIVVRW